MRRRLLRAVPALAVLVTLGGCGLELADVPMPATVPGETYELSATFETALNLPVGAPVKLDGDRVGEVTDVAARDYRAVVTFAMAEAVQVPRRTRAAIRTSSPMGEAFLELDPRGGGPSLADGDRIGAGRTETAPDVPDLLAALSVVTTGGSFADIGTIVDELDTALEGNGGHIRSLVARLDHLLTGLNAHTAEFDRVLDGLDVLGGQLAEDSDRIVAAVDELRPAIRSVAGQRAQLMTLLREVVALGETSTRVVGATREQLVADLRAASLVLDTLVEEQRGLAPTLRGLRAFARKLDDKTPTDFALFDLRFITYMNINGLPIVDGVGDGENLGIEFPEYPFLPELPDIELPLPGLPGIEIPPSGAEPPGQKGTSSEGLPTLEQLLEGVRR